MNNQTAAERINNDAELSEYRDLFIDYDWDNDEEHAEWVATAGRDELLDWARGIRDAEEGRA